MRNSKTIAFLMLATAITGCGSKESTADYQRTVEVTHPVAIGNVYERTFTGVVRDAQEISLGFKTPGQIEAVYVDEGDYVRSGQIIARLDDSDYKLGVEGAKVQYEQTKREVERLKTLYESKSISGNDYDKAVSGLKALKVQLQSNENKLSYTVLRAPASGYIKQVNFEKSEMVDAGTPVATLLASGGMEVEVDVPASVYMGRNDIKSVTCSSAFSGGIQTAMKIAGIVPSADGSQLYRMRLAFSGNMPEEFTSGLNVAVNINFNNATSDSTGFILPMNCIYEKGGKSYVWTVGGDSTAIARQVEIIGIGEGGKAIVEGGLKESDNVVSAGVNSIAEKEKVKIIGKPAKTNIGGLI